MAIKLTETEKKIRASIRLLEKHGYTVIPPQQEVVIDTTELNKRKLEMRKQSFISELRMYLGTYSSDMLNAFYAYWSEPNKTFTKMRFEMQKTWDLKLRLNNWFNRNKNRGYGRTTTDEDRKDKLASILTD